jgi:hypothetical protein
MLRLNGIQLQMMDISFDFAYESGFDFLQKMEWRLLGANGRKKMFSGKLFEKAWVN